MKQVDSLCPAGLVPDAVPLGAPLSLECLTRNPFPLGWEWPLGVLAPSPWSEREPLSHRLCHHSALGGSDIGTSRRMSVQERLLPRFRSSR